MVSSKLLSLINRSSLPSDLSKLLDEPIIILKGAEAEDLQALENQGLKKIKDLVQIDNIDKYQQYVTPLLLEKLVTSAKIIDNLVKTKESTSGKKVVVAGLDAAGKTTIIQTILRPLKYNPANAKPTPGIENSQINLFGFDVNLWDLGGQSVYRSEYLGNNSTRHFGFTNLFIYVIDVQAPKRFNESFNYLSRILEIYKHLGDEPYCLILIHKSDPDYNPKDIRKRTEEISAELKKLLVGFHHSIYNTTVLDHGALFAAFSKGIREISMVKDILSGILKAFQEKMNVKYLGLYDRTGICLAETAIVDELLKDFTINTILGEELNLFPAEAIKLILALKNKTFCTIERIERGKDRFYLAWHGGENLDTLIGPPLFEEMQPWIINFLN
ncbi:MAG: ADP-ribosylation factor-like protein [Candidatus Helarchaeota archaeon]